MSRMSWTCPACRATNYASDACEACGTSPATTDAGAVQTPLSACPMEDGGTLDRGICSIAGGYPITARCGFLCPYCRKPLTWNGGCSSCFGRRRTGEPRSKPGDRYEIRNGHWMLVAKGPRMIEAVIVGVDNGL